MRISIVGAGPAGLYFSILMKRLDPSHEITIYERNPPDATFGWGVVFSEGTLGELREADYESYIAITDSFTRWDAIDIHHRERVIRARGQAFSAISRKRLLALLQHRARELEVELVFEAELADLDGLDAELIVGADGVNSLVRALRAEAFVPDLDTYRSKYAWFGTDLVFDAFTFIFKETEHGVIQAHAYPFDAELSTFIVECNDDVWDRAGLADLSEAESIRFCEELFADELGGHSLLSNRSIWMSFVQVANASWHDRNVVLLGDSAHTAHFSIGSGTKLAMESAVALANAFVRHRDDLEQALVDYELERAPMVERFQQAARDSATYFENAKHYVDLDPVQFSFNLLTRSGRIGYANLSLRDPVFVRALDSWFAWGRRDGDALPGIAPPPMFAPLAVGGRVFANRGVLSPPVGEGAEDGIPSDRRAEEIARASSSGAGLILTEAVAISSEGRITPECPTLESERHAQAWAAIVDQLHARSAALISVQLSHAGRRASTQPHRVGVDLPLGDGGWPVMAASPLPYSPRAPTPKEMDRDDMNRVRTQFATATSHAAAAGFDLLELNLAQGYLLASFLSPLTNRREDEFGGSLEGRLEYPLAVFEAVRAAWPADRPLVARISASDWKRGGSGVDEAIVLAGELAERGAALVHVVAGQTVVDGTEVEYRRAFLTALSDQVRSQAGVPTIVGGYITTVDEINTAVGAGRADLCILESRAVEGGPAVR